MKKRKREEKRGKRILAVVLTMAMLAVLPVGIVPKDKSKVQAAIMPGNPRTDSNGVVTWDRVYFGRYPQSDRSGIRTEPIKWRVLSVNGNDAFLVADCNLDTWYYNIETTKVTWENSTMRSWLNGYGSSSNADRKSYEENNFIGRAFSASEQAAILPTVVVNAGNPDSDYTADTTGNNTSDKVFLLSYAEVTNPAYGFSSDYDNDPARERTNTAYVAAGGSTGSRYTYSAGNNGWWWLRTPGHYLNNALYVYTTGKMDMRGDSVGSGKYAVCPALHLDLSVVGRWSYAGTVDTNGTSTPGEAPPSVEEEPKTEEPVTNPGSQPTYEETNSGSGNKTVEYIAAPEDVSADVVIPDQVEISGVTYTVTSIADNAFKNNKKIKKVVIGNNVKSIGKNAFMGCSNLQTVTMGKNVTSIGVKAFYKCTKLTKITIPAQINKIGKQAFYGCKRLKTVTVKTTKLTKKKVGSKAFKGIHSKATFKVPAKKLKSYKTLLKAKGAGSKMKIKK